jgi:hypothetical protein
LHSSNTQQRTFDAGFVVLYHSLMRERNVPGPLAQIIIGAGVSLAFFGTLGVPGCNDSALPAAAYPELVACKLDALKVLPPDEDMVTVGDARDIYRRLRACHAQAAGDGGTR